MSKNLNSEESKQTLDSQNIPIIIYQNTDGHDQILFFNKNSPYAEKAFQWDEEPNKNGNFYRIPVPALKNYLVVNLKSNNDNLIMFDTGEGYPKLVFNKVQNNQTYWQKRDNYDEKEFKSITSVPPSLLEEYAREKYEPKKTEVIYVYQFHGNQHFLFATNNKKKFLSTWKWNDAGHFFEISPKLNEFYEDSVTSPIVFVSNPDNTKILFVMPLIPSTLGFSKQEGEDKWMIDKTILPNDIDMFNKSNMPPINSTLLSDIPLTTFLTPKQSISNPDREETKREQPFAAQPFAALLGTMTDAEVPQNEDETIVSQVPNTPSGTSVQEDQPQNEGETTVPQVNSNKSKNIPIIIYQKTDDGKEQILFFNRKSPYADKAYQWTETSQHYGKFERIDAPPLRKGVVISLKGNDDNLVMFDLGEDSQIVFELVSVPLLQQNISVGRISKWKKTSIDDDSDFKKMLSLPTTLLEELNYEEQEHEEKIYVYQLHENRHYLFKTKYRYKQKQKQKKISFTCYWNQVNGKFEQIDNMTTFFTKSRASPIELLSNEDQTKVLFVMPLIQSTLGFSKLERGDKWMIDETISKNDLDMFYNPNTLDNLNIFSTLFKTPREQKQQETIEEKEEETIEQKQQETIEEKEEYTEEMITNEITKYENSKRKWGQIFENKEFLSKRNYADQDQKIAVNLDKNQINLMKDKASFADNVYNSLETIGKSEYLFYLDPASRTTWKASEYLSDNINLLCYIIDGLSEYLKSIIKENPTVVLFNLIETELLLKGDMKNLNTLRTVRGIPNKVQDNEIWLLPAHISTSRKTNPNHFGLLSVHVKKRIVYILDSFKKTNESGELKDLPLKTIKQRYDNYIEKLEKLFEKFLPNSRMKLEVRVVKTSFEQTGNDCGPVSMINALMIVLNKPAPSVNKYFQNGAQIRLYLASLALTFLDPNFKLLEKIKSAKLKGAKPKQIPSSAAAPSSAAGAPRKRVASQKPTLQNVTVEKNFIIPEQRFKDLTASIMTNLTNSQQGDMFLPSYPMSKKAFMFLRKASEEFLTNLIKKAVAVRAIRSGKKKTLTDEDIQIVNVTLETKLGTSVPF